MRKTCYFLICLPVLVASAEVLNLPDTNASKAEFVNSDSQLYKQAGNGVTVAVVEEIGKAIAEVENK